jgi:hypothetical protein
VAQSDASCDGRHLVLNITPERVPEFGGAGEPQHQPAAEQRLFFAPASLSNTSRTSAVGDQDQPWRPNLIKAARGVQHKCRGDEIAVGRVTAVFFR